jgi:hypothetical protein
VDDRTRTVAQETPAWEPERRNGKVEIGVNCWNEASQRMVFDSVSPQRYIELSDAKQLKHQQENKPKPEHLPTRDEVVRFLEQEKLRAPASTPKFLSNKPGAMTASMPAIRRQPKKEEPRGPTAIRSEAAEEPKVTTVVVPKDSFLAGHFGLADKPTAKPVKIPARPVDVAKVQEPSVSEADLDSCARKIPWFTERDREIARDLAKGKKPTNLSQTSLPAKVSELCTRVGIPKTNCHERFNRLGALKQVWARYEELVAEGNLPARYPSAKERMLELQHLFVRTSPEEQLGILKYVRSLKPGG